ncbi:hypothetical protein BaRGS_00003172 [Batillaria attramentaria]|uniref:Apoptosis regulatory protein Siva n=1 Tax=Batillaria attramentaria TaxID=370345 RepID=A0ABD0M161_9CAEN
MPKRPNPFADYAPVQFKTHIGVKEIDCGVRQDELMKGVYEKTRQMLFSGAHRDINENHMTSSITPQAVSLKAAVEPTQSRLDSQGHLLPPSHGFTSQTAFKGSPDMSPSLATSEAFGGMPEAKALEPIPGQLCLDSRGQLTAPMDCDAPTDRNGCGAFVDDGAVSRTHGLGRFGFKSTKQASGKAESAAVCQTCRRPLAATRCVRCQFCEKGVCVDCVRQCDRCYDNFCQVCTTINYDEAMERIFCLNCID